MIASATESKGLSPTYPLRVMIVVEPCDGGVFRHVEQLTQYLLSQNVEICLVTSSVRTSVWRDSLVHQVQRAGGVTSDIKVGAMPSRRDIAAFRELIRMKRNFRPDIIHAHSSKAGALVRTAGLVAGWTGIVYTPNAYYAMNGEKGSKALLFSRIEKFLGRVGTTINVSEDEFFFGNRVLHVPSRNCVVIPNGVDVQRFRPATSLQKQAIRTKLGIPAAAVLISTIARYTPQKDPRTFAKAMSRVMREDERVWLVQVGKGELKGDIVRIYEQAGVEGRVKRLDFVADSSDILACSDGFVLASKFEGLPISIMEAMATNLPMVLADCVGNGDYLRLRLPYCWSYPPGEVSQLISAITGMVITIEAGVHISHRDIAVRKFSDHVCMSQILNLYRRLQTTDLGESEKSI